MLAEQIRQARAAGYTDDEIAQHISGKDSDFAGKLKTASDAGWNNSDVLNHLAGTRESENPLSPKYIATQAANSFADALSGTVNTAGKLGIASPETVQATKAYADSITGGVRRDSASERFKNPKAGDFTIGGYAPAYLPATIAEGAAGLAVDAGAMAAGGAVAGPVGAFALPVATYAFREGGNRLDERVANQGGAPATGLDAAAATGTAVAEGALNRVGLGAMAPAVGIGARSLLDSAKRVGAAIVGEGTTNAAQSLVQQVGTSAGTKEDLKVNPKELLDAAVIGGATGGAIRGVGELGVQGKNVVDRVATRGLEFKEEAVNVANELKSFHEANNRTVGNAKQDTQSLVEYRDKLAVMRDAPTKRTIDELDKLRDAGQLSVSDHADAVSALTKKVTARGLEIAERAVGGMGEAADAIAFAKRSAIVDQIMTKGGYSKDGIVKGGLTAKGERLLGEARNSIMTAGLGGLAYAGYKGLGTFGATLTSIQSAVPAAGALLGTYVTAKIADRVTGMNSPTAQVMRRFGTKDGLVKLPSDGGGPNGGPLPRWRELDEASKAITEQQKAQQAAQDAQYDQIRRTSQLMANSEALAQRQENATTRGQTAEQRAAERSTNEVLRNAKYLARLRERTAAQEAAADRKTYNQTFKDIRYTSGLMAKSGAAETTAQKAQETQARRGFNETLRGLAYTSRLMQADANSQKAASDATMSNLGRQAQLMRNSEKLQTAEEARVAKEAEKSTNDRLRGILNTSRLMQNSERMADTAEAKAMKEGFDAFKTKQRIKSNTEAAEDTAIKQAIREGQYKMGVRKKSEANEAKAKQAEMDAVLDSAADKLKVIMSSKRLEQTQIDKNRGDIAYIKSLMEKEQQRLDREAKAAQAAVDKAENAKQKADAQEKLKQAKAQATELKAEQKKLEKAQAKGTDEGTSDRPVRPADGKPDAGALSEATRASAPAEQPVKPKRTRKPPATRKVDGGEVFVKPMDAFKYADKQSADNAAGRGEKPDSPIKNVDKYTIGTNRRSNTKVVTVREFRSLYPDAPKALLTKVGEFTSFNNKNEAKAWVTSLATKYKTYSAEIKQHFMGGSNPIRRTMK